MEQRSPSRTLGNRAKFACLGVIALVIGNTALIAAEGPVRGDRAAVSSIRSGDRAQIRANRRKPSVTAAKPVTSSDDSRHGRYQMTTAGERVVVLDTQTGETKIIDPAQKAALQNVEVGRAWVVVTVLGSVSERPADSHRTGK